MTTDRGVGHWYPLANSYFIQDDDLDEYPIRQGDVVAFDNGGPTDSKGKPWLAAQIVQPSCEIQAKLEYLPGVQVIRVRPTSTYSKKQQPLIINGFSIALDGKVQVAQAHTFWLPPIAGVAEEELLFSDFRAVAIVPNSIYQHARRCAGLTHDTRVAFIRRKLYWEQRWAVEYADVRNLEADRIRRDPKFRGSRPDWATVPT